MKEETEDIHKFPRAKFEQIKIKRQPIDLFQICGIINQ